MTSPFKGIYILLILALLLSLGFLAENANTLRNTSGQAFYLSGNGTIGMTEPGAPLPEEVARTNTTVWGIITVVLVGLLVTARTIEKWRKT